MSFCSSNLVLITCNISKSSAEPVSCLFVFVTHYDSLPNKVTEMCTLVIKTVDTIALREVKPKDSSINLTDAQIVSNVYKAFSNLKYVKDFL